MLSDGEEHVEQLPGEQRDLAAFRLDRNGLDCLAQFRRTGADDIGFLCALGGHEMVEIDIASKDTDRGEPRL
ncbi:hypothetical protein [Caballeronia glebae]|uniref:hypothetical protein n=1 Tax=Caballeronia glebae TaxID=1777143 RepID=UPI001F3DD69B|nr:hypothetical protein [Caballeronia glebae]